MDKNSNAYITMRAEMDRLESALIHIRDRGENMTKKQIIAFADYAVNNIGGHLDLD